MHKKSRQQPTYEKRNISHLAVGVGSCLHVISHERWKLSNTTPCTVLHSSVLGCGTQALPAVTQHQPASSAFSRLDAPRAQPPQVAIRKMTRPSAMRRSFSFMDWSARKRKIVAEQQKHPCGYYRRCESNRQRSLQSFCLPPNILPPLFKQTGALLLGAQTGLPVVGQQKPDTGGLMGPLSSGRATLGPPVRKYARM